MSAATGLHLQGLQHAASVLRKRGLGTSRSLRRLRQLDDAHNLVRHVTEVSCTSWHLEIMQDVAANLSKSDPLVASAPEEFGKHAMAGRGEVPFVTRVQDLRKESAQCDSNVADPVVPHKDTVSYTSNMTGLVELHFGTCETDVWMECESIDEESAPDVQGDIGLPKLVEVLDGVTGQEWSEVEKELPLQDVSGSEPASASPRVCPLGTYLGDGGWGRGCGPRNPRSGFCHCSGKG